MTSSNAQEPVIRRLALDEGFPSTDAPIESAEQTDPAELDEPAVTTSMPGQVLGTRTKRQRRRAQRLETLAWVREMHTRLAPDAADSTIVAPAPRDVSGEAKALWRSLEADRIRAVMGDSRWIRNPPYGLGRRGRKEFLQAERAAVRTRMRQERAPGGAYTAQEQQRGALVLALLVTLIPLAYLVLTSCGA